MWSLCQGLLVPHPRQSHSAAGFVPAHWRCEQTDIPLLQRPASALAVHFSSLEDPRRKSHQSTRTAYWASISHRITPTANHLVSHVREHRLTSSADSGHLGGLDSYTRCTALRCTCRSGHNAWWYSCPSVTKPGSRIAESLLRADQKIVPVSWSIRT